MDIRVESLRSLNASPLAPLKTFIQKMSARMKEVVGLQILMSDEYLLAQNNIVLTDYLCIGKTSLKVDLL